MSSCQITGKATLTKIKSCARSCARKTGRAYWFERGSMQFFNTRLYSDATFADGRGNAFFVTSEAMDDRSPRRYSVRRWNAAKCSVETVGKFHKFRKKADAVRAARNMARRGRK